MARSWKTMHISMDETTYRRAVELREAYRQESFSALVRILVNDAHQQVFNDDGAVADEQHQNRSESAT